MGTPLTPEEQDTYAPPTSTLRKMLDAGDVPWPTSEEVAYEDLALKLLSGEWVFLPIGDQPSSGRRAGLEISLGLSGRFGEWRIVHKDLSAPEDTMGAPDFPMEKPDQDPWSPQPAREKPQPTLPDPSRGQE